MIRLIGPGGAGKSSTGPLLAARLGVRFVDLDERFGAAAGDISKYIESRGYDAYAATNVQVYADLVRGAASQEWVLALSSGFMTCREDVHPAYVHLRRDSESDDIRASPLPGSRDLCGGDCAASARSALRSIRRTRGAGDPCPLRGASGPPGHQDRDDTAHRGSRRSRCGEPGCPTRRRTPRCTPVIPFHPFTGIQALEIQHGVRGV